MDIIDTGCQVLRSGFVNNAMIVLGYFGHGVTGAVIGLALGLYGIFRKNKRMMRIGAAVILSMAIAGSLANLLQPVFEIPRPRGHGYGFPSGHTGTAFGLASALSLSFPQIGFLFYFFAIFTGISRLYLRAHFVLDVLGGALLGTVVGSMITKRLIGNSNRGSMKFSNSLGWFVNAGLTLTSLFFFLTYEKSVAAYRLSSSDVPENEQEVIAIDFGTPEARKFLDQGWSADEFSKDGKTSVIWAGGLQSSLIIPFHSVPGDWRLRLRLLPNPNIKCSCQRMIIQSNGTFVARLDLEYGWEDYEVKIPRALVKDGSNAIEFFFSYTGPPRPNDDFGKEAKALSVIFDSMKIYMDHPG